MNCLFHRSILPRKDISCCQSRHSFILEYDPRRADIDQSLWPYDNKIKLVSLPEIVSFSQDCLVRLRCFQYRFLEAFSIGLIETKSG